MDPNSGKKGMFNKLSKEQAIDLLKHENFKRKTVSFYRYVIIRIPKFSHQFPQKNGSFNQKIV